MGSEKTMVTAHNQSNDGACEGTVGKESAVHSRHVMLRFVFTHLPSGGLSKFCCIFNFVCSR